MLEKEGIGCIVFSPLAQGHVDRPLSARIFHPIPRATRDISQDGDVQKHLPAIRALNAIAKRRGQPLAEMALAWVLRLPVVTSALIGASSIPQLESNVKALTNLDFSREELTEIRDILRSSQAFVKLPHRKADPSHKAKPEPAPAEKSRRALHAAR